LQAPRGAFLDHVKPTLDRPTVAIAPSSIAKVAIALAAIPTRHGPQRVERRYSLAMRACERRLFDQQPARRPVVDLHEALMPAPT
jgi:hypothetical protein